MTEKKVTLVESLLAETSSQHTQTSQKPLIQEIGDTTTPSVSAVPENVSLQEEEEPSLMDMMMAAQQEAKKVQESEKKIVREKESKSFGGGFKKGFLGGGKKSTTNTNEKKSSKPVEKKIQTPSTEIPTITGQSKSSSSLIIDDVQDAMKEDSNPLLQQINKGEWATPELMNQLQENPILARGLNHPKCLAALQLLQSNPNEAKIKFQNDPEVSLFLQEFGKVMSSHFFALGEKQTSPQSVPVSSSSSSTGGIQEIGPLHAEVLARQKQQKKTQNEMVVSSQTPTDSDEQVKQVLENDELRSLLLDSDLQRILQECSDPIKFQSHMRNPLTAQKIKKLYDAGLVGTTK